jgi:hypothetical protein
MLANRAVTVSGGAVERTQKMKVPRIRVDFNEMIEADLVLLSQTDAKADSSGALIALSEGSVIHVYDDNVDYESGRVDNLIADGVVERHPGVGWGQVSKWCCRIDKNGIRHESEE